MIEVFVWCLFGLLILATIMWAYWLVKYGQLYKIFVGVINEVVRGEQTSIDSLREELIKKLKEKNDKL
ncbi:MAG: hypothetical protein V3W20_12615 [Candidatus Neomarinimicrobiota bacterium]